MESLNERAFAICQTAIKSAQDLGIGVATSDTGDTILDFGVVFTGSIDAGLVLARICLADSGQVERATLEYAGSSVPAIRVQTSQPLRGCMASQYAGWQISVGKYFAMCSGPIRAVYAREPLFEKYPLRELSGTVVGVLESAKIPDRAVLEWLREKLGPGVKKIVLCVARTSSIAGRIQIVARSVETACHKLHELGFDLRRIVEGDGIAPIPRDSPNDMHAMGMTNDAILYGARVKLVVDVDDAVIDDIGPRIPSCSSPQFGKSFATLFAECGGDFYKLDPMLFAPAEITLQSRRSGYEKRFGEVKMDRVDL